MRSINCTIRKITVIACVVGVLLGGGVVADVVTAQPAQAASEHVVNVKDSVSNYSFTIVTTTGQSYTLTPDQGWYGGISKVKLYSWECAHITTSTGAYVYLTTTTGNTFSVPDGASWRVNPFKGYNGKC